MSKIIFKENHHKKTPSFKYDNMYGYYCFGKFNGENIFEICTSSKDENDQDSYHYRQVIDIDKEEAIKLIDLLRDSFNI